MENKTGAYKNIKGWGIDADPENEPTYPIKNYTGDDHNRLNWERPGLQPVTSEVLHSNERPYMPAVFGTSVPPKGLSGMIRRFAFRYSEGSFIHWLPLVLADRVNMVEGLVEDIRSGYIPNIFAERGWKAEWKLRPVRLVAKVALVFALAAIIPGRLFGSKKGK